MLLVTVRGCFTGYFTCFIQFYYNSRITSKISHNFSQGWIMPNKFAKIHFLLHRIFHRVFHVLKRFTWFSHVLHTLFTGLLPVVSVMEENEVSLKRSHQPSHDTPGKPRSKRRSSVSSVSTPVRRSISSSFSSKTTARSPAQKVRFKHLSHYVCRVYNWLLFCVQYHLENDGLIDLSYKLLK